jgi:hypothetical protein
MHAAAYALAQPCGKMHPLLLAAEGSMLLQR